MNNHVQSTTIAAIFLILLASASSIQAEAAGLPSTPIGLTALPGDGQAVLNWTPPSDCLVNGYWIYRGTSAQLDIWTTLGNVTTFTDVGLVNGKEYHYAVRAVNGEGPGNLSTAVSVIPMTVPSAPILPTAIPGNGYLQLTWQAPNFDGGSAILGYRVYESPDLSPIGITDQELFIHANLQIGEEHAYRVAAYNIAGEGAMSAMFSGVPDVVPGAPRIAAVTGGVRNVSLTWETPQPNGGSPIIGYKVYKGASSGQLALLTTLPLVQNYTDFGLENDNVLYYAISAFNLAGEGDRCAEVMASVLGLTRVNITSVLEGDGKVGIFWTAFNDNSLPALRYWVYRGMSPDNLTLLRSPLSDCGIWDEGLQNGITYYYQVAVENPSGIGWSEVVAATPSSVPSAPVNLTAHYFVDYAKVSWEQPIESGGSPVIGYKTYLAKGEGPRTYLGESASTSFTVTDLKEGCEYTIWVSACNDVGEGARSDPLTFVCGSAPSAPSITAVEAGDGRVRLTWSPPNDEGSGPVQEYLLVRSGGSGTVTEHVPGNNFNDSNVTNGVSYTYYVVAVNAFGSGKASESVNATPLIIGSTPGHPGNLTAAASEDYIFLTWQAASDGGQPIQGYEIYRGLNPTVLYYMTTVQETWYNDTDLPPDSTYYYKIAAKNAVGLGNSSDVVNATTGVQPVRSSDGGWSLGWFTMPLVMSLVIVALGIGIVVFFRTGIAQGIGRRSSKNKMNGKRPANSAKRPNTAKNLTGQRTDPSKNVTPKRPRD